MRVGNVQNIFLLPSIKPQADLHDSYIEIFIESGSYALTLYLDVRRP